MDVDSRLSHELLYNEHVHKNVTDIEASTAHESILRLIVTLILSNKAGTLDSGHTLDTFID